MTVTDQQEMVTVQGLLKALEANLGEIRTELGAGWTSFHNELILLREHIAWRTDHDTLERVRDAVWQICSSRPFVKGLILGYVHGRPTLGGAIEPGTGYGDEMHIREIVNCFQSLFEHLEEMGPDVSKHGQESETAQSGPTRSTDARRILA